MNQFIRKRANLSWHVVATPTRVPNSYVTLCGRAMVTNLTRDTLPGDEKTCERCAVLRLRQIRAPEDDGSTWTEGAEPGPVSFTVATLSNDGVTLA